MKKKVIMMLLIVIVITTVLLGCGSEEKVSNDTMETVEMVSDIESGEVASNIANATSETTISEKVAEPELTLIVTAEETTESDSTVNGASEEKVESESISVNTIEETTESDSISTVEQSEELVVEEAPTTSGSVIVCKTFEEADALCGVGDTIEVADDGSYLVIKGDGTIPNINPPSYFENPELVPEILDLINAERARRGLSQVVWNSSLDAGALQSAINVEANFSHDAMAIHPGAENIGKGQTTVQEIFDDWMASPGHEIAMMDEYLLSISCARYKDTWVYVGIDDTEQRVADFNQQIDNGEIEPSNITELSNGQTIEVYITPGADVTDQYTEEEIDQLGEQYGWW